jgi:ATP-dependent RNA helicase DeaD
MNLAKTCEDYVHRAGRTGRLGRTGKVVTLIQPNEEFAIRRYMNELNIDIKLKQLTGKSTNLNAQSPDN